MTAPRYDIPRLKTRLDGIPVEDNPALVKQKSRDFFWYSPVLKRELDHVTGDLIVSPRDKDELARTLAVCFAEGVPVTPRGSGTGNYGQAMPLSGGVVLNLAQMDQVLSIEPGRFTAQTGAIMARIDQETRTHSRQELRMFPSTYQTASIGGFVAGGSGGVGSIAWGGLRDLGNILSLELMTMEAAPRLLRLTGEDIQKAAHAYGTTGIITEVEMPLTHAYEWVEAIIGFDDFLAAATYANELGCQDGLLKKLVSVIQAPVAHDYFPRHRKFIERRHHVVLVMVARHAVDGFETFTRRFKGAAFLYRSDCLSEDERHGLPPLYELAWNHTTLRALRVDPAITYLQVLYPFPHQLERIAKVTSLFGDEVLGHLEFVRFDGNITCFGLPLVRFTTEERLDEIIRLHEDNGCPIFNPHRYTLEEGGMKQTDSVQLAAKREADPAGLLNPGKMIGWEDPNHDFSAQKNWLFPGLARAS